MLVVPGCLVELLSHHVPCLQYPVEDEVLVSLYKGPCVVSGHA